jgi:GNAT superfamily N-acetyltransferase
MSQSLQPGTLKFEIRRAQASEIDRLTELHMAAFRPEDNIAVLLGRRYVWASYRWLVTSKRAYTLVAVAQDKIIGLVAVADIPFTKPMVKACLPEFLWSLALKPSLFFNKKLWWRLIRKEGQATKIGKRIVNCPGMAQMTIGLVDKEFRGKSIFPTLIEATKDVSRSRGSRAIRAGIYKPNQQSRRCFEKVGWVETPELETVDLVFYMVYLDPNLAKELRACIEKYK